MPRVLIASPIRQEPDILDAFLGGLEQLDLRGVDAGCLLIDDNDNPASSARLYGWRGRPAVAVARAAGDMPGEADRRAGGAHHWTPNVVWRVAAMRDWLLGQARDGGYDGLLLLDSDLVLQQGTLQALLAAGRDIVSEVFWTVWPGADEALPNVWAGGQYQLFPQAPGERLTQGAAGVRQRQWLALMRQRGLHEVGGLGACTLISRRALVAGVSYARIPTLDYWGEDRHFCVRAQVLGLQLWAHSDPATEPVHIYRPEDLQRVAERLPRAGGATVPAAPAGPLVLQPTQW